MYLKEIGKVPLLTAAQEVDSRPADRGGEFATVLRELTEEEDRVDQKRLRQVTESVVAIREHQVEKFGKVEGSGGTGSARPTSRRPARRSTTSCAASNATASSPSAS